MQGDESMLANGFEFKCGHFPQEVLAPKTAEGPTVTPEPGRSGVPCSSNSYTGCCTEKASLRLARRTCACFVCAAGAATGTPLTHVMLALAVISTRCHAEVKRAKNAFPMLPANWRSNYSTVTLTGSALLLAPQTAPPSPAPRPAPKRGSWGRVRGCSLIPHRARFTFCCSRKTCVCVLSTRHQYLLTHEVLHPP